MKVKIGPYPRTMICATFHSDYMDKKYDYGNWEKSNTRFEKSLEKLENIAQTILNLTINKILTNRKRKIKIHIHEYDTWNLDNTLAHIILPALKQLKKQKFGSPYIDDEDVPEDLKSTSAPTKENAWDTDENHHKRWDYVVDEMIYAFECEINDDWEEQFYTINDDTFKFDNIGWKASWDRRQNAMRLFGKYYSALWS